MPTKTKRPAQKQKPLARPAKKAAEQGVKSAQKVFAKFLEKAED